MNAHTRPAFFLIAAIVVLALTAVNTRAQNNADDTDLYGQVLQLQEHLHIEITGLEHLEKLPKIRVQGNWEQQLEQLLAAFNHLNNRNAQGQLARVVILNKKQKRKAHRIVLPTRQEGNHLLVSVSLSGDGRLWQTLDMLIDTGADWVVLPESMIAKLGLAESNLTRQTLQTANGTTTAQVGVLQELKIAGETVTHVDVAFIADKLLGGGCLLGMSVLGRYRLTIDDKSHLLTLFTK